MDRRLLLVAALVLVCTVGTLAAGTCEPDCDGKEEGDKVPHPYNCTNYYYCLDDGVPSDAPIPCPDDEIFVEEIGECGEDYGDGCSATCQRMCDYTCSDAGDFIADPNDCGIYRICGSQWDIIGIGNCPVDLPYFNGDTCVGDESVCCTNQCIAYCYPEDMQVPDPLNCTGFYMCSEEGPADPALHHYCPVGEVFHLPAGRCLAGMPCVTLCGDSSGTTPAADCVDSFLCPRFGSFAACQSCQPQYFKCSGAGVNGVLQKCPFNYVFNTDPDIPYCLEPDRCPYSH